MLNLYIDKQGIDAICIEINNFNDSLAQERIKAVYFKNAKSLSKELHSANLSKLMLDIIDKLILQTLKVTSELNVTESYSRVEINKHENIITVNVINTTVKFKVIFDRYYREKYKDLLALDLLHALKRLNLTLNKLERIVNSN